MTSIETDGQGIGRHETGPQYMVHGKHLNYGEADQMEIEGYRPSLPRTFVTWIFIILTLGLLRLVFHWWPKLHLQATHVKCSNQKATKILAIEEFQQKYKRYHVKPIQLISMTSSKMLKKGDYNPKNLGLDKNSDSSLVKNKKRSNTSKLFVPLSNGIIKEFQTVRTFICKKQRYIWNNEDEKFIKLSGLENPTCQYIHQCGGLSNDEECQRRLIFGSNEIDVNVQSLARLLFLEALNPFYIFQLFAISIWMSDSYYYYASAVIIMSVLGIVTTIIQVRQNQKKLRDIAQSSDVIKVCRRGGNFESVSTQDLVPGDLIVIPSHGCTMHCDAALLAGQCIVNESMLTGESVPVTKIPLPNRSDLVYSSGEYVRSTLFSGTQILQTRTSGKTQVLAVVLRTGFCTSKGKLVGSILYPPPSDFKFERDSYKFIAVLAAIASAGLGYSLYLKISDGATTKETIIYSLTMFTILIPPALPAAMTVGRVHAQRRLKKKLIYCISPRAINVSGSLDCVCFDKTGTLTEEGLDILGVVAIEQTEENGAAEFEGLTQNVENLPPSDEQLLVAMAACHSLTKIDENIVGDPLDLKMFQWTGWSLEESDETESESSSRVVVPKPSQEAEAEEIGTKSKFKEILTQFPFSSNLQRMSVLTKDEEGKFELYAKGSPEIIKSLALPHTIPPNFLTKLEEYTKQGYRVIAFGHRLVDKVDSSKVNNMNREDVEKHLNFLGFLIMENRLKKETTGVIQLLKSATVRCIMVTGDNILTAISVAGACDMLDKNDNVIVLSAQEDTKELTYTLANLKEPISNSTLPKNGHKLLTIDPPDHSYQLATDGTTFKIMQTHYPELLPRLLVRGTVFARMSPEQKQTLVELLQQLGYYVGMCGDGANDCGALKVAHAGISLSQAESSIASPFTYNDSNITCVPELIREGRSALVTSFGIFKYMSVYSLTQFITVFILYTIASTLADLQYLYIDLFLITFFAIFFGHTGPYSGALYKMAPSTSLVSLAPILSIVCQIGAILGFQAAAFFYVQEQKWFVKYDRHTHAEKDYRGYENYALFSVSAFQYIIMAFIYSRGKPYRKSILTNYGLLAALVVMTGFSLYLVLRPPGWAMAVEGLQILPPPVEFFSFRLILVAFAACNFVAALLIEYGLIDYIVGVKLDRWRFPKEGPKSKRKYHVVDYELEKLTEWPPLGVGGQEMGGTTSPVRRRGHDNPALVVDN